MEVISHRGYWKTPEEKNEMVAFDRSFSLQFGTETDVRDHNGGLVICHDMPTGNPMPYADYLASLKRNAKRPLTQAINIKADGLAVPLAEAMKDCGHPWFVFDMSIPDTIMQLKAGNPVFVRMSEYEPYPEAFEGKAKGIWLDGFDSRWFTVDTVTDLLNKGWEVCIVSPELHKRADYAEFWQALKPLKDREGLILCSDLPEDAVSALEL